MTIKPPFSSTLDPSSLIPGPRPIDGATIAAIANRLNNLSPLTVDDGSTTVSSVTDITFTGATVSEIATGHAGVEVSGGGGLSLVTVPFTADQINHLFSAPQTLIDAPGTGKAIIVAGNWGAVTAGTIPFNSENGFVDIYYGSASGEDINTAINDSLTLTTSTVTVSSLPHVPSPYTQIENLPLVLAGTGEDFVNGGAIASATLGAGGLAYAPGDTGTVSPEGVSVYVVDTIGAGGAVLTFHFSDAGYGNNVGDGHATVVSTGIGDGNFTINITKITPGNGKCSITVSYYILTLPT